MKGDRINCVYLHLFPSLSLFLMRSLTRSFSSCDNRNCVILSFRTTVYTHFILFFIFIKNMIHCQWFFRLKPCQFFCLHTCAYFSLWSYLMYDMQWLHSKISLLIKQIEGQLKGESEREIKATKNWFNS